MPWYLGIFVRSLSYLSSQEVAGFEIPSLHVVEKIPASSLNLAALRNSVRSSNNF